MGRPKTINFALAEFCVEALKRFRQKQKDDPAWVPNESQARVLKLLAETQVIIQRRKPEEGDEESNSNGSGMSIEQLEMSTLENKPPPASNHDDGQS